jgi:hypothetical protein
MRTPTSRFLMPVALAVLLACGGREAALLTQVPVYPGATLRESESLFQQRLLSVLLSPGAVVPRVEIYETSAAFAAVLAFYETYFAEAASARPFAVAGRLQELAERARAGGAQPVQVGRLLFGRGASGADSLSPSEIADSLSALSERLAVVEGTIALGRIPLATTPPSEALVSIEHPHLNAEALVVDSLTVFTIAVQLRAPTARR